MGRRADGHPFLDGGGVDIGGEFHFTVHQVLINGIACFSVHGLGQAQEVFGRTDTSPDGTGSGRLLERDIHFIPVQVGYGNYSRTFGRFLVLLYHNGEGGSLGAPLSGCAHHLDPGGGATGIPVASGNHGKRLVLPQGSHFGRGGRNRKRHRRRRFLVSPATGDKDEAEGQNGGYTTKSVICHNHHPNRGSA